MDGIGHHGGTVSHNAGHELEEQQQHIHCAAHQRHPIDLALSPIVILLFHPCSLNLYHLQRYCFPAKYKTIAHAKFFLCS